MDDITEILNNISEKIRFVDYFRRRVLTSILVFVVVLNLVFILPRLVPGNAAEILASGSHVPAVQVKLIEQRFGLDQPIQVQYLLYLKNIFLTWPPYFGSSFTFYPSEVTSLIAVRISWTFLLIFTSLAISIALSYVVAGISSLRRGGKFEFVALYSSIIFNSTPIFWTAMVFLWVLGIQLHLFPLFGSTGFKPGEGVNYIASIIWHAILPIIVLTMSIFGESYLLLRGSTQEVLKSDFTLAAKTRGLRDRVIASNYVLRNSMLPLVAVLSFSLASLISRVVLVELVFGYPGIGDLIIDAVGGRDYPVLEGSLFYLTILVIIGGLIGDALLLRLDPRIRRE